LERKPSRRAGMSASAELLVKIANVTQFAVHGVACLVRQVKQTDMSISCRRLLKPKQCHKNYRISLWSYRFSFR